MTRTHKEQLLADLLAALLRIEAKLDTAKVADSEVDYWVRELSQPRPVPLPGMPDPPIAPVRPQTVWGGTAACATAHKTSLCAPADKQPQWTTPPAVNKANAPSLNQGRGWIHATGFSMVGP